MAKVKAASAAASPKTKPADVVAAAQESAAPADLEKNATAAFLNKDFERAAQLFGQLVSGATTPSAEQAARLKRAGCFMQLKKFDAAAADCTAVLQQSPGSAAALKTRIKALQSQGKLKLALADLEKLNATDGATKETREQEKAIKQGLSGRPASAPAGNPAQSLQLTIKACLGAETRVVYADVTTINYANLLMAIKAKYPEAGPVLLKYQDAQGDLVTITSTQDVQSALTLLVIAYRNQQKSANLPRLGLPPLRITVQPVARESMVPPPAAPELAELGIKDVASAAGQFEMEEWLSDFIRLFQDITGLDPAAHMDSSQAAQDKIARGMHDTLAAPEAEALLDAAADHYRDAVVTSYIQWGNVYINKADRKMQELQKTTGTEGQAVAPTGAALDEIMALYAQTQAKIEEALRVHPTSWEALGGLAQLEWERAKAKLGYHLQTATPTEAGVDTSLSPEQQAAEVQALHNKRLVQLLSGVPADRVQQVAPLIESCSATFVRALEHARAAQAGKEAKEAKDKAAKEAKEAEAKEDKPDSAAAATTNGSAAHGHAGSSASAPEAAPAAPAAATEGAASEGPAPMTFQSAPSNVAIMHGNILYDWSQVLSVTGAEPWRPVLDRAAALFRSSGAPETDVRTALKNHLRASELDLGPDPAPAAAPEVPATPQASAAKPAASPIVAPSGPEEARKAPAAAPAPEAKGLPSLRVSKPAAKK